MPCYKINTAPSGYGQIGTTGYATEAECLEACGEGACCDGTTCSVKPQCQCNAAAGEVFKGVGTVCSPNPCLICGCVTTPQLPASMLVEFSGFSFAYVDSINTLSDMTGAEQFLANFLHGIAPLISLSFDSDTPVYSTGGCTANPCPGCATPFYSRSTYQNNLPIFLDSIRIAFPCSGGVGTPSLFVGTGSGLWFIRSAFGCPPEMPQRFFYGGNDSFFDFSIGLSSLTPSPTVCDFASGEVGDFEIDISEYGVTASWTLPYQTWRGFGNTGRYTATAGTVKIKPNPLP